MTEHSMRPVRWWAAIATLAVSAPLQAQGAKATIAVLPFENGGSYGQDKENFDALEVGLPALLASTLAAHPETRVVDRSGVRDALHRQQLDAARRIDASSATQVARATGARYVVTGSFADFYGKFRINARIVDAESGEILTVVSNDDPKLQDRAQLAAIVQLVSERVVAAVGLPPLPAETAAQHRAVPTEAITDFSRGLLYEGRGDASKAADAYRRALTAYPAYPEAREGLARTKGT
jgi:TolB-like protein